MVSLPSALSELEQLLQEMEAAQDELSFQDAAMRSISYLAQLVGSLADRKGFRPGFEVTDPTTEESHSCGCGGSCGCRR